MEGATDFLKKCDASVRQNEALNFLNRIDFDAEKKRISARIQNNKGASFVVSQTDGGDVANRQRKAKPFGKPSDPTPWKPIRLEANKRPNVTPLIPKVYSGQAVGQRYDTGSVQRGSPGKMQGPQRVSRGGADWKEKSECSRSQFHLSVLKSEKLSTDTRTKKSAVQHLYDGRSGQNLPRNGSALRSPPDAMEDQAKLTVFKNTIYSNGHSLQARK